MYISPFFAGVLATIAAEFALVVAAAVVQVLKKKK